MAAPTYIPSSSVGGLHFSHTLACLPDFCFSVAGLHGFLVGGWREGNFTELWIGLSWLSCLGGTGEPQLQAATQDFQIRLCGQEGSGATLSSGWGYEVAALPEWSREPSTLALALQEISSDCCTLCSSVYELCSFQVFLIRLCGWEGLGTILISG